MSDLKEIHKDAKIGIVGEILDTISPVVEPSESALLFPLLCALGNVFGSKVYINIAGSKHSPRLFTVLVGETSKGRKGTSWAYVRSLLEETIPSYVYENTKSGLSTGEGLINDVRDDLVKTKINKKTGEVEEEIEPGIADKRRLIIEPEFARTLRAASRETNILSTVIRDAWDTGNLLVLTKQPYKATGVHVSIIGHITQRELNIALNEIEQENGFANRFMWVYTERVRLTPFGQIPENSHWEAIKYKLSDLLKEQEEKEYTFTPEAQEYWAQLYEEMAEEHGGLIGVILARGEPIILRIALIYAILDKAEYLEVEHLKAGKACYDYVEYSVKKIFPQMNLTDSERKIIEYLKQVKKASATELYNLFSRNTDKGLLTQYVDNLIGLGIIKVNTVVDGVGRPAMMYELV